MTISNNTDETRAAKIRGLHQLADYLQRHPDVPLPAAGFDFLVSVDSRTRVEQAAETLEVGTTDIRGCFEAARRFAGDVTIKVYCLDQQRIERYRAELSYAGHVTP